MTRVGEQRVQPQIVTVVFHVRLKRRRDREPFPSRFILQTEDVQCLWNMMERENDNEGLLHVISRKRKIEINDGGLVPLVMYALFPVT